MKHTIKNKLSVRVPRLWRGVSRTGFLTLLLASLLSACEKTSLAPKAYVSEVQAPENGLFQHKVIDRIDYSIQYKPHAYIVAMEERQEQLEAEAVNQRLDELQGMHYFNMRLRLDGSNQELLKYQIASDQDYQQRIYYLSFGLKQDIYLQVNDQQIPCELFHFARNYGLSPTADFVLGFPMPKDQQGDLQLVLEDRIFNNGTIKFTITQSDLENTPRMQTH